MQHHKHYPTAFLLFLAIFLNCLSFQVQCLDENTLREWARQLGNNYNQVAQDILQTQVYQQFLQDRFNNRDIRELSRNGETDVADFAQAIGDIVQKKDAIIREMQTEMQDVILNYIREDNVEPQYFDSTDPNDISRLNLQEHPNFPEPVDTEHSVIRFAPGVTDEDATVRDHLIVSQSLEPVFRKYQDDTTWQYFGSQTGFYRQYPGREWTKDSNGEYTEFDPRLRPWYVGSTSGPKNVLILYDISGTMSLDERTRIGRLSLMTVLDTLTERDFVNVILFNHNALVSDCFPDTLVRAIPRNIQILKDFIQDFNPGGQTDYANAFSKAFSLLRETRERGIGSFCETVILFITDGYSRDPSNVIEQYRDPDLPLSIFSYAIGEDANIEVPQRVACENDGLFFHVPDGNNLRSLMGNYYQYFAAGIEADEVFWTAPYFDASGLGLVITASIPLYDRREDPPRLFGVVGTDVVVSELLLQAYTINDDDSYGFVINGEGQVLAHPLLKPPTDFTSPPVYIDIADIENSENFDEIRSAMLEKETGSFSNVRVTRDIPAGDLEHEGVRQRSYQASYFFHSIPDSDFSVCLVIAADDEQGYAFRSPDFKEFGRSIYHRIDLYNPGLNVKEITPSQGSSPLSVTLDASTFKIAPRGFSNPYGYENLEETAETAKDLTDYVNDEGFAGELMPRDSVLTDILLTRYIESNWKESFNNQTLLWMYIGTQQGVWRSYPGHNTTKNFDPVNRPWYLRAVAYRQAGVTLSTPYQDASFPDIRVVTISKSIQMPDTEKINSVMGMDYQYKTFAQGLEDTIEVCSQNNYDCYLVDEAGMLVVHSAFDNPNFDRSASNVFMGEDTNLRLNDLTKYLVDNNILAREEYSDMQTLQKIIYYRFDHEDGFTMVQSIDGCYRGAQYGVAAVPDTNLYLIISKDVVSDDDRNCQTFKPEQQPLDLCDREEMPSVENCPAFFLTPTQLENLRQGACDIENIACTTNMNILLLFVVIAFLQLFMPFQ